jgi:hypothetical protein
VAKVTTSTFFLYTNLKYFIMIKGQKVVEWIRLLFLKVNQQRQFQHRQGCTFHFFSVWYNFLQCFSSETACGLPVVRGPQIQKHYFSGYWGCLLSRTMAAEMLLWVNIKFLFPCLVPIHLTGLLVIHVDGVRLCLWTATINEPIVHPAGDVCMYGGWKSLSHCHFVHHK